MARQAHAHEDTYKAYKMKVARAKVKIQKELPSDMYVRPPIFACIFCSLNDRLPLSWWNNNMPEETGLYGLYVYYVVPFGDFGIKVKHVNVRPRSFLVRPTFMELPTYICTIFRHTEVSS